MNFWRWLRQYKKLALSQPVAGKPEAPEHILRFYGSYDNGISVRCDYCSDPSKPKPWRLWLDGGHDIPDFQELDRMHSFPYGRVAEVIIMATESLSRTGTSRKKKNGSSNPLPPRERTSQGPR